jgi:hypothetical protein
LARQLSFASTEKRTDMTSWKELGATAPSKMTEAHLQPYQLAQWLARFARGYLEARPDDSHTSLNWRRDLGMMTTGAAANAAGDIALGLSPQDLTLALLVDGKVADEAAMHGREDARAGDWLGEKLTALGLDPKVLDAPSPYDIPPSPYVDGAHYDQRKHAGALAELRRYLDNASLALEAVIAAHSDIQPGPSPARLWPHHFDIATTIALEEGDFETARSIGAGLAVPDTMCTEFYLYAYPWPNASLTALKDLGPIAKYQHEGFTGALLPMSAVANAEDQQAAVSMFFDEAIEFFMALLQSEK